MSLLALALGHALLKAVQRERLCIGDHDVLGVFRALDPVGSGLLPEEAFRRGLSTLREAAVVTPHRCRHGLRMMVVGAAAACAAAAAADADADAAVAAAAAATPLSNTALDTLVQ